MATDSTDGGKEPPQLPKKVGETFKHVVRHATDPVTGEIDLRKIDALEGRYGGRCDVIKGPCACGAWH